MFLSMPSGPVFTINQPADNYQKAVSQILRVFVPFLFSQTPELGMWIPDTGVGISERLPGIRCGSLWMTWLAITRWLRLSQNKFG